LHCAHTKRALVQKRGGVKRYLGKIKKEKKKKAYSIVFFVIFTHVRNN